MPKHAKSLCKHVIQSVQCRGIDSNITKVYNVNRSGIDAQLHTAPSRLNTLSRDYSDVLKPLLPCSFTSG